ncbi:MAG: MoxR family ATPase [Calditrichaeota bacterium]|nr:MoxR family ATPase [Calditrichota bacterium]
MSVTAVEQKINSLVVKCEQLKNELQKTIIGQDDILDQLIISLLAGGHSMLEGVPGLAKTLMIRSLAQAINLSFKRIQFTPDLMPSDIIGTEILEEDHSSGKRFFKFNKGPIFAQIILADEINRTPPKTQSALLEAMQEFEVTYGGHTYQLDRPFFILATQNPIEQAGTFPLPEAQLDRFLLYINIDYPEESAERDILSGTTGSKTMEINPVLEADEIIEMQKLVRDVTIADELIDYVNTVVRSTRPGKNSDDYVNEWVRWGAGLRAGQAMILTAKAHAFLNGRFAVTPEDLHTVAKPVLRHRILMNYKAEAEQIRSDSVTDHLLNTIKIQKKSLI